MILVQSISTPIIQVLVASALSVLLWLAMSPAVLETMSPGEFVTYIVVAGSMPSKNNISLYCAVIVKRVDAKTRSKTAINELLRD